MPTETGQDLKPHHKNRHLLERFEGATDLLVVAIIIALGAAMLIGLLTADGKVSWN
jgi:hypothetical protein